MTTSPHIRSLLVKNGGIALLTRWPVARLPGAGRLGRYIRNDIVRQLNAESISIWPRPLPNDQRQVVTLFGRTSPDRRLSSLGPMREPRGVL